MSCTTRYSHIVSTSYHIVAVLQTSMSYAKIHALSMSYTASHRTTIPNTNQGSQRTTITVILSLPPLSSAACNSFNARDTSHNQPATVEPHQPATVWMQEIESILTLNLKEQEDSLNARDTSHNKSDMRRHQNDVGGHFTIMIDSSLIQDMM